MDDRNWSAIDWFTSNNWKPGAKIILESAREFFWKKWSVNVKWWWRVISEQPEETGISMASTMKNNEILSSMLISIESSIAEITAKCFKFLIRFTKISKESIASYAIRDLTQRFLLWLNLCCKKHACSFQAYC